MGVGVSTQNHQNETPLSYLETTRASIGMTYPENYAETHLTWIFVVASSKHQMYQVYQHESLFWNYYIIYLAVCIVMWF